MIISGFRGRMRGQTSDDAHGAVEDACGAGFAHLGASGPTAVTKSGPCPASILAIAYSVSGLAKVTRSRTPLRTAVSR